MQSCRRACFCNDGIENGIGRQQLGKLTGDGRTQEAGCMLHTGPGPTRCQLRARQVRTSRRLVWRAAAAQPHHTASSGCRPVSYLQVLDALQKSDTLQGCGHSQHVVRSRCNCSGLMVPAAEAALSSAGAVAAVGLAHSPTAWCHPGVSAAEHHQHMSPPVAPCRSISNFGVIAHTLGIARRLAVGVSQPTPLL